MSLERTHARRLMTIACAAGLSVLVAVPSASAAEPLTVTKSKVLRDAEPIPQASAAKKGKRKATTRSEVAPFASGTSATATGSCKGKSHLTGGGFAVSPAFNPLTAGGLRSQSVISFPGAKKDWTAGSTASTIPAGVSGTLTSFARCESNSLGRTIVRSLSGTVPPGTTTTALLDCPRKTHAVGGGYAGTPLAGFTADAADFRTFILESRRSLVREWRVTAYTANSSPVAAPFTGYVICERDGKGRNVTQASTLSQIPDNGRAAGDPSCGGKRHVVSGGFAIADADPNLAVAAFFDESHPVGKKGWHVGMWEPLAIDLPAGGATLESFAYCKRIPKPKR